MFTIYYSDVTGVASNCSYPHKKKVVDEDSLKEAISHDYVCAEYKNSYRNGDNFIGSDCIPVDCDNDHSNNPKEWVTPSNVKEAFPNVTFAIHYSRSNNKSKNGKLARPKFHVLFPIDYETDPIKYKETKLKVNSLFPYFDTNALDAARFFFGTKETEVEIHEGSMNLSEYLNSEEFEVMEMNRMTDSFAIKEGSRNSTLSHFAGRVIKKYGDTEKAYEVFMEKAALCEPPLDDEELVSIWYSAKKFYKKLSSQEGYVDPEQYNQEFNLEPLDYSDVGQAIVLAKEYENKLKYSPSTDFLVYNGSYWEESRSKAQAISQELTTRQLEEAEVGIKKLTDVMIKNGAWDILASVGPKKAVALFNEEQSQVFKEYEDVTAYRKYAIKRRDSKYIYASLKEVSPMVEIKQDRLDSDEFLLNTPKATYDLRYGDSKMYEHSAEDFITKQTTIDPTNDGVNIWNAALNTFFCDDKDLIKYVQEVAGLSAIGKVHLEGLIIAYGGGRNGKSTFWNTISKILGTYSGNMSADTLTVGCKRNVKPEMAEIKGKRLVIAAELEEGMRFNTSNIKQLCSTDEIYAEKKYKEPFKFEPTHTLVLYTNHLPKVGAIDEGTWRRLIVIPFNAKIEGSSDIKNYADYLYENAGGAILKWVMEGAKRVIDNGYHLTKPSVVTDAIKKYKESNNWFSQFLAGSTPVAIAKALMKDKIKSPMNKDKWNASTIRSILRNEKYKGDALLQKNYTVDFLTKKQKVNEGEIPQYYVENNHEAIITSEMFEIVQAEIERRRKLNGKYSGVDILTAKIICGECGGSYGSKVWHSNDKYRKVVYQCNQKYNGDKKCETPILIKEDIENRFINIVNEIIKNKDEIIENLKIANETICDTNELEKQKNTLHQTLLEQVEKIQELIEINTRVTQNQEKYQKEYEKLINEYEVTKAEHKKIELEISNRLAKTETMELFINTIKKQETMLTKFDEVMWGSLLECVKVYTIDNIIFKFRDGTEIKG